MTLLCDLLDVSCSGYYAWAARPAASARAVRRRELAGKIARVHGDSRQLYGSPRVHQELLAQGERVSVNTVASIMRERQIRSKMRRKYRVRTTDSRHDDPVAPNLLDRLFEAELPDQKWCVDITYVATGEGWLYLAAVIDLCTRRIVGWSMRDHMRADLCADAMTMALARRGPGQGLLHHSDRGVQYASADYRKLLADHGIEASMSRKGDCYDNAPMESFFATLKSELIGDARYPSLQHARDHLTAYIDGFYNRRRLHTAINYAAPNTLLQRTL